MSTIQVKPAPSLPAIAAKAIVHPASGSMLDAAGNVPADGRPWLYDGFTCRMLADGVILRTDDPAFAVKPADAPPSEQTATAELPATTEPPAPAAATTEPAATPAH